MVQQNCEGSSRKSSLFGVSQNQVGCHARGLLGGGGGGRGPDPAIQALAARPPGSRGTEDQDSRRTAAREAAGGAAHACPVKQCIGVGRSETWSVKEWLSGHGHA